MDIIRKLENLYCKILCNYINQKTKLTSKNRKTWVSFGDSVTANNNWQPYVANKYRLKHVNKGIGGTFVSWIDSTSMCDDVRINDLNPDADIITFMGGINDWRNNIPLGTINDSTNATFYGAVKIIAEKLINRYHSKNIVFMSTTYALTANRNGWKDTSGYKNNLGLTSGDYGKALMDVARLHELPCIDMYCDSSWDKSNISEFVYLEPDNSYLHPNNAGAKKMSALVIDKFKELS